MTIGSLYGIDWKKTRCKICGEYFDPLKTLEHAVIKHNDKDAKEILEQLNKLSKRGT